MEESGGGRAFIIQRPSKKSFLILFFAALSVFLSVHLFFFSKLNIGNWKDRVYNNVDTTGQIWWAIQFKKHGILNRNPDPHPFHSSHDLLIRFHLNQMVYSSVLPLMDSEFELTYASYKKVVYLLTFFSFCILGILFFSVSELAGSSFAGFAASLFYSLHLPSAVVVDYIFTETLFTFLFLSGAVSLIFGMRDIDGPKAKWMFLASGLLFGLSALTRTNGIPAFISVAVSLLVWTAMNLRAKIPIYKDLWKKSLSFYLIWLAGFSSMLSIRFYQTYALTGKAFLTMNGIYATEVTESIKADSEGRSPNTAIHLDFHRKMREGGKFEGEIITDMPGMIDLNRSAEKEALEMMRQHPLIALKHYSLNFLRLFHAIGRTDIGDVLGNRPSKFVDLELVKKPWMLLNPKNISKLLRDPAESGLFLLLTILTHLLLLYFFAISAIVYILKRFFQMNEPVPEWLIVSVVLTVFLAASSCAPGVNTPSVRFRVPLIPLICLMAGVGSFMAAERFKSSLK